MLLVVGPHLDVVDLPLLLLHGPLELVHFLLGAFQQGFEVGQFGGKFGLDLLQYFGDVGVGLVVRFFGRAFVAGSCHCGTGGGGGWLRRGAGVWVGRGGGRER